MRFVILILLIICAGCKSNDEKIIRDSLLHGGHPVVSVKIDSKYSTKSNNCFYFTAYFDKKYKSSAYYGTEPVKNGFAKIVDGRLINYGFVFGPYSHAANQVCDDKIIERNKLEMERLRKQRELEYNKKIEIERLKLSIENYKKKFSENIEQKSKIEYARLIAFRYLEKSIKNPRLAIDWFKKASELGDIPSIVNIGNIYLKELGDKFHAAKFYKEASLNGSLEAERLFEELKLSKKDRVNIFLSKWKGLFVRIDKPECFESILSFSENRPDFKVVVRLDLWDYDNFKINYKFDNNNIDKYPGKFRNKLVLLEVEGNEFTDYFSLVGDKTCADPNNIGKRVLFDSKNIFVTEKGIKLDSLPDGDRLNRDESLEKVLIGIYKKNTSIKKYVNEINRYYDNCEFEPEYNIVNAYEIDGIQYTYRYLFGLGIGYAIAHPELGFVKFVEFQTVDTITEDL